MPMTAQSPGGGVPEGTHVRPPPAPTVMLPPLPTARLPPLPALLLLAAAPPVPPAEVLDADEVSPWFEALQAARATSSAPAAEAADRMNGASRGPAPMGSATLEARQRRSGRPSQGMDQVPPDCVHAACAIIT